MYILLGIIGLVAIAIGSFIVGRSSVKTDGMFIVDDTNDETTKWILDVSVDPATIPNRKIIRLKVKKISDEGDV